MTDTNREPDWIAKSLKGDGSDQKLHIVGAAWSGKDGEICLKLSGTQVVENDIHIVPNK